MKAIVVTDQAAGTDHARDRGPEGGPVTPLDAGAERGLTPANDAHGALPRVDDTVRGVPAPAGARQ